MSSTPGALQGKVKPVQSASKSRTPLNSTFLQSRGSVSKFPRSASASNLSVQIPNSKTSLVFGPPAVDYDLECDFAYSEYLQALMKKEIAENTIQQHEGNMNGQIIIQRENLHKGKVALERINQEIAKLEELDNISELVTVLSDNLTQFFALSDGINLEDSLPQILALLNAFANRITVRNVKKLEKQEDFDKLNSSMKQCVSVFEKMNLDDRNMEEVNHLATIMKKYQEELEQLIHKQSLITIVQNNAVYKLFSSISDMYAKKERSLINIK